MSIGRLPTATTVSPSDGVAVYSRALQGNVQAPVSALADALRAALVPVDGVQVQRSAPVTGATVAVTNLTTPAKLLMIQPAAPLATLTVRLPAAVDAIEGQLVTLYSTAAITTLTLVSTGATFLGGAPAALPVTYRYDGVLSAWVPVAGGAAGGAAGPDLTPRVEALEADVADLIAEDYGYRNLRRNVYGGAGSSIVLLADNGKAHHKTTAIPVTVPNTLPDEFMTTVINWTDSDVTLTFASATGYAQDGSGDTGSDWIVPARCTATIVRVGAAWMISGPVTLP